MEHFLNIRDYLAQGGWIMLPLLICSLAMWGLIIDRFGVLARLRWRDLTVEDAVRALQGQITTEDRTGLRAEIVREVLLRRTGTPEVDVETVAVCAKRLRPRLRGGLMACRTLASVAPLLGLLGTVVGMVETFDVIATFGTGNARALSGGISIALVTTQCGLLVAIPGLLISRGLERMAEKLESRLAETTLALQRQVASGHLVGDAQRRTPS